MVVAADAVIPVNDAQTDAVEGITFVFPGAAAAAFSEPSLAGQTVAVKFNNPDTGPTTSTVNFTSSTGAATGSFTANVTYGSCIFAVTQSTFPAGNKFAVGSTIVVNPCNINVNTAGLQATGVAASRSVALALGSAISAGSSITLSVSPGGQLTLNGVSVGGVTLVPVSG